MFDLIFGPVIALVKTVADGWLGHIKAKQQLRAAVVTRKLEMIADKQHYNEQWELAALQDSDRLIKRLSFLLLSAPLITSIFMPAQTESYITHVLGTLPVWYTTAYMGMLSSIWAVKSLQSFRNWRTHNGTKENDTQENEPEIGQGRPPSSDENSDKENDSNREN